MLSTTGGDADWLDNGDVLAVFGAIAYEDGRPNIARSRGPATARIIEIVPDTGETVFDVDVWAEPDAVEPAWRIYRAARVADPR
jgi:hypothetical protein